MELNKYIGYTSSYVPVELLSATGAKPYRLLHGTLALSKAAEEFCRIDACPLIRSSIGYLIEHEKDFVAVVGATTCDMSRRMYEIIKMATKIPVYLMNSPRTDYRELYYDEIDWLVSELENLSKRKFTSDLLLLEIEKWSNARIRYQTLEQKRSQIPSCMKTTDFHRIMSNYSQGNIELEVPYENERSTKPRVFLMGSPIPYEASRFLELIENELRIVGDFNSGIARPLNIKIQEHNLVGIKAAYYDQPQSILKRPNKPYFEWVGSHIKQLACAGIVYFTLDYCDSYEFELRQIEKIFRLPVLWLRSDLSFQNLNQLRTRIQAFKEVLCSKT